jgi:hypothetical protein
MHMYPKAKGRPRSGISIIKRDTRVKSDMSKMRCIELKTFAMRSSLENEVDGAVEGGWLRYAG